MTAPWPMLQRDRRHSGVTTTAAGPKTLPAARWTYTCGGKLSGTPVVGENGRVYVCCEDGKLYAINDDGSLAWSHDFGYPLYKATPALDSSGNVYAATNVLKSLNDARQGQPRWQLSLSGLVGAAPVIDESNGAVLVVSGTSSGSPCTLVSVSTANGVVSWSAVLPGATEAGAAVGTSPAIDDQGNAYLADSRGNFYLVPRPSAFGAQVAAGDITVKTHDNAGVDYGGFPGCDVALSEDGQYAYALCRVGGSSNSRVLAFAISNMGQSYAIEPPGAGTISTGAGVAVDSGRYVYAGFYGAVCVTDAGAFSYKTNTTGYVGPLAVDADGTIFYTTTFDPTLYAVNGFTSEVLWSVPGIGGPGTGCAIGADGTVYVTSADGTVSAFGGVG